MGGGFGVGPGLAAPPAARAGMRRPARRTWVMKERRSGQHDSGATGIVALNTSSAGQSIAMISGVLAWRGGRGGARVVEWLRVALPLVSVDPLPSPLSSPAPHHGRILQLSARAGAHAGGDGDAVVARGGGGLQA